MNIERSHKIYIVSHVPSSKGDAQKQIAAVTDDILAAIEGGADGVFLIGHSMKHWSLAPIVFAAKLNFPQIPVGVNYLDKGLTSALTDIDDDDGILLADMLWSDDAPVRYDRLAHNDVGIPVYVGVAFKYKPPEKDLEATIRACVDGNFIVTTSGDATGVAPTLSKLSRMRSILGPDHVLALASGVTAQNIKSFMPFVDHFFVASSVVDENDRTVASKVRELVKAIH